MYREHFCILVGVTFFRRNFLVSAEKFCEHPLNLLENLGYRKLFMHNRGYHKFPSSVCVSQCRKILWASLQCFRTIGILKNSMHTRGYHVSPSKLFGLTVPKKCVGVPSIFQKSWGIENLLALMGITIFRRKFLSQSAEKFCGHPFNVSEKLGYRKILCNMGGITIYCRKFFVSQCRKNLRASLQCFRKFEVSKNFMHNRGYHIFPSKNFFLTVPKTFVGIPSMFQKLWGLEKIYA